MNPVEYLEKKLAENREFAELCGLQWDAGYKFAMKILAEFMEGHTCESCKYKDGWIKPEEGECIKYYWCKLHRAAVPEN